LSRSRYANNSEFRWIISSPFHRAAHVHNPCRFDYQSRSATPRPLDSLSYNPEKNRYQSTPLEPYCTRRRRLPQAKNYSSYECLLIHRLYARLKLLRTTPIIHPFKAIKDFPLQLPASSSPTQPIHLHLPLGRDSCASARAPALTTHRTRLHKLTFSGGAPVCRAGFSPHSTLLEFFEHSRLRYPPA
jgi:hypothetical protein